MVQMCPDEALAHYLHGFQMVPEMVQDGSDMVQMCSPGGGDCKVYARLADGSGDGSGWLRQGSNGPISVS